METIRKDFKFKADADGLLVCSFLELLGRKQSKFVADLILQFLKENGITSTENIGPQQAKAIVQSRMCSEEAQFNKILRYLIDHGVQCNVPASITPIPTTDAPITTETHSKTESPLPVSRKEHPSSTSITDDAEFDEDDNSDEEASELGDEILAALGMFNQ